MNVPGKTSGTAIPVIRWTARILSLVFVILLMIIFVGETWNKPVPWPALDAGKWYLMASLAVTVLGLLLAWRWELAGALMNIGGTLAFATPLIAERGLHADAWILAPLTGFGWMFLLCWWSDRRRGPSLPMRKEELC